MISNVDFEKIRTRRNQKLDMFGMHRPLDLEGFESADFAIELSELARRTTGELVIADIGSIALTLVTRDEVRRLVRKGGGSYERKEFGALKRSVDDSIRERVTERIVVHKNTLTPELDVRFGDALVLTIDPESNIHKYLTKERGIVYRAIASKVGAKVKKVPPRDSHRLVLGLPLYPDGQTWDEYEDYKYFAIDEMQEFLDGCPDLIVLNRPTQVNRGGRSQDALRGVE